MLRYIRSDMYTASATNYGALCLSTPKNNGKSGIETTYVNSVFESHSWRGVLDRTLCDKVCQ